MILQLRYFILYELEPNHGGWIVILPDVHTIAESLNGFDNSYQAYALGRQVFLSLDVCGMNGDSATSSMSEINLSSDNVGSNLKYV
jgi:hypothetical protein